MKLSQKLSALLTIGLIAVAMPSVAHARTNMSDGTGTNMSDGSGTNMSDGSGTNMSDGSGTNMSDGSGTNTSDHAALNQLAENLGTAYESCQGGAGCGTFYELYEQAKSMLP